MTACVLDAAFNLTNSVFKQTFFCQNTTNTIQVQWEFNSVDSVLISSLQSKLLFKYVPPANQSDSCLKANPQMYDGCGPACIQNIADQWECEDIIILTLNAVFPSSKRWRDNSRADVGHTKRLHGSTKIRTFFCYFAKSLIHQRKAQNNDAPPPTSLSFLAGQYAPTKYV